MELKKNIVKKIIQINNLIILPKMDTIIILVSRTTIMN